MKLDYCPYGTTLDGRNGSTPLYRYGFQGQEEDDEIKGDGNSVNYKYRMHDPRIGRFFAVDPLAPYYPHNSPYAFSENRVIDGVELEGLEQLHYTLTMKDGKPQLELTRIEDGWLDNSFLQRGGYFVTYGDETYFFSLKGEGGSMGYGSQWDGVAGFSFGMLTEFVNDPEGFIAKDNAANEELNDQLLVSSAMALALASSGFGENYMATGSFTGFRSSKVNVQSKNGVVEVTTNQVRFGGRIVIVDQNLSPTLVSKLQSQGFNVVRFKDGTDDADILSWAKQNEAIILTNNIKHFKNQGVTTVKVSEFLKRGENVGRVVNKMVNLSIMAAKNGGEAIKVGAHVSLSNVPDVITP